MENKVVAKVNGSEITEENIRSFIERLDPKLADQYRTSEGRKQILNELINQKLFFFAAVDSDLEESEIYKRELEIAREFILTQMSMNGFFGSYELTEDEIKAHFMKEPGRFGSPEMVDSSHILVDNESLCKELREKIINDEISFEEAAKEYSQCPSKDQGGQLGKYPRGKMVPEYDDAAFALAANEISEPVKTRFGYHLIRVNEKTQGKEAGFEEVKEEVSKDLLGIRQRNGYINKVNELRQKYEIELY